MKKVIFSIIIILICGTLVWFCFFHKGESNLKKVRVAEVTHSIFYAPQYLAHSLGYFEEEGLDVEIILTSGADKVTTAVLSGDVEIGFCGSEATIYVYNNGEKDYLVNFAGLTKKDGSFLVSRTKEEFNIKNLIGKHIIAGRRAGMPAMTLEYALNTNGVKTSEVNFDTSIDFASTTGAFIGGTGDYVSVFDPTASALEKQGVGYIVASIGQLGGVVPYTAYNARLSYIENNEDIIKGFTKAIDKALIYVKEHNSRDIAEKITSYFPDTSIEDITAIVERYKNIDAWFDSTIISEQDFNHVMDIMENAKELTNRVPYNKLVMQKK